MDIELPRVLTAAGAANYGVTRSRIRTELRRGRWRAIGPGLVLTRSGEPTRLDWADAGLALAGPTAALSGWDACRCYGVGDRHPPAAPVLVLSRERRSRSIGDLLIRRTDRPYRAASASGHADLPYASVVSLARGVADAALELPRIDTVRALVAGAVRSGRCTVAELADELVSGPRRQSGRLRLALSEVADGARSAAEARAVGVLRRAPVPRFEVNVPVIDRTGRTRWVLDILWRRLRAVLEIDSVAHHFDVRDWQATLARHNQLQQLGLAVAHCPPAAITRAPGEWAAEVELWLSSRARELGVPYRPGGGVQPAAPFLV